MNCHLVVVDFSKRFIKFSFFFNWLIVIFFSLLEIGRALCNRDASFSFNFTGLSILFAESSKKLQWTVIHDLNWSRPDSIEVLSKSKLFCMPVNIFGLHMAAHWSGFSHLTRHP